MLVHEGAANGLDTVKREVCDLGARDVELLHPDMDEGLQFAFSIGRSLRFSVSACSVRVTLVPDKQNSFERQVQTIAYVEGFEEGADLLEVA